MFLNQGKTLGTVLNIKEGNLVSKHYQTISTPIPVKNSKIKWHFLVHLVLRASIWLLEQQQLCEVAALHNCESNSSESINNC
jgi:hypothetical protein